MEEINDEYIINKYIDTLGRIQKQKYKKMSNEEYIYLLSRFNDSDSIDETIHRINNKIEQKPKCIYCGKSCRPKNSKFAEYYNSCNNKECINKESSEKHINTFSKNHNGISNPFQLPEVIKKYKTN